MRFKYGLTAVQMAASACKKRKRVLSLENKLSILDRLAKSEKATKVASEFGTGTSTVTDLKKNESRFRWFVSSTESLSVCTKERKIMRFADDDMYMDVCTCTHYDVIIVCKKTIYIHVSENSVGPNRFGYERIHCTFVIQPNEAIMTHGIYAY